MARYVIKLEHENNANSAFIVLIKLLVSQGCESGLIDQGGPGGLVGSVGLLGLSRWSGWLRWSG